MNDLISIVVPVYNGEQYIKRSIKSILDQTYSNFEVIAVDDGSKDRSLEMLYKMGKADHRLQVICQENRGVTSARITGIKAAKGIWIGFVDVDDEIEPIMYERLLKNAHKFNADISHCGYQMVFPNRIDYYYNSGRLLEQDKQAGLKDLLNGSFIEPGLWNKLYHRSLFDDLLEDGTMDTTIKNTEDLLMNFYLFRNAKTSIYEDICPYHYIVREGSAATARINENKLRDPLRVLKIIQGLINEDTSLNNCVNSRIVGQLIRLATMEDGEQAELIRPYKESARKELMELIPELLRGEYSNRTKALATWASISPSTYALAHRVYSRVRGTDRKYEV